MAVFARVIGSSAITGALGAGIGIAAFGSSTYEDYIIPVFLLACVGAIIGAIAGATREIVAVKR